MIQRNEHNFYHISLFTNGISQKESYAHAVLYVTTTSVSLLVYDADWFFRLIA